MKCIIGLGNPGVKYQGTRHNVGFKVVHELAKQRQVKVAKEKYHSLIGQGEIGSQPFVVMQPLTYMNNSGKAVKTAIERLNLSLRDILVVYDDMDFDVGDMRFRLKGSSGGHKGLASIVTHLNTNEFARLRIGIGRSPMDAVDYVLAPFSDTEKPIIEQVIKEAVSGIECFILSGITEAMNRYNKIADNT